MKISSNHGSKRSYIGLERGFQHDRSVILTRFSRKVLDLKSKVAVNYVIGECCCFGMGRIFAFQDKGHPR
jgi:hypothetical protein